MFNDGLQSDISRRLVTAQFFDFLEGHLVIVSGAVQFTDLAMLDALFCVWASKDSYRDDILLRNMMAQFLICWSVLETQSRLISTTRRWSMCGKGKHFYDWLVELYISIAAQFNDLTVVYACGC